MASNTYRPFQCSDCGDALSAREVANESPVHVEGTAGTRVRRINRYCGECHAANEYKTYLAMRAYRMELYRDMASESSEMAQRVTRKMVEQGDAANLSEALEILGK